MDHDHVVRHRTVVIRGDTIAKVDRSGSFTLPAHCRVIEGSNHFLMPGLADMHVHLQKGNQINRVLLVLFLLHGITTVRNMWGLPEHLVLRERIARGELIGPQIFTTGPVIDGPKPLLPGSLVIETPENAREAVNTQRSMGYDFLKVYDNIPSVAYLALTEAARESGMPVIGHVPHEVGLERVLRAGQKSIEHLEGYAEAIESDRSPYRDRSDWMGRALALQHMDNSKLRRMALLTARARAWNCPTLVVIDTRVNRADATSQEKDLEMSHIPSSVRRYWQPSPALAPSIVETLRKGQNARRAIVLALLHAGAPLLTGTDCLNAGVAPGRSLAQEIRALTEAGLTSFQALRAATVEPARFFGSEHQTGMVAVGMRSDLVLLNKDPLEDISAVSDVSGVMVRGHWFTRSDLLAMLSKLGEAD